MFDEYQFHGFYRAIVIDNNDPLKSGRVKVKVMPMFGGVNDDALPWAILADASMGNIDSGHVNIPEINSHVFVFFENGDHRYPVYFASTPSIQNGVPDIPQITREADQSVTNINSNAESGISTAGGGSWNEPNSAHATEYPNNHVIKTKNGLMIELDDTDGQIRLHFYHPSGSREEIDNDGNRVIHTTNNRYTVTISNDMTYVKGNSDETIDGNKGIKVGGTLDIVVDGDVNITSSSGNVNVTGALINLN